MTQEIITKRINQLVNDCAVSQQYIIFVGELINDNLEKLDAAGGPLKQILKNHNFINYKKLNESAEKNLSPEHLKMYRDLVVTPKSEDEKLQPFERAIAACTFFLGATGSVEHLEPVLRAGARLRAAFFIAKGVSSVATGNKKVQTNAFNKLNKIAKVDSYTLSQSFNHNFIQVLKSITAVSSLSELASSKSSGKDIKEVVNDLCVRRYRLKMLAVLMKKCEDFLPLLKEYLESIAYLKEECGGDEAVFDEIFKEKVAEFTAEIVAKESKAYGDKAMKYLAQEDELRSADLSFDPSFDDIAVKVNNIKIEQMD